MPIQEFSLRLQKGITGGFAPPTPSQIATLDYNLGQNFLRITNAVRPLGTPSLQDAAPKSISAEDEHTVGLVAELIDVLQKIPTEVPPGSQDIYGLDTSIAFLCNDIEWMNGGPSGCAQGVSDVQPTDKQKALFKRAVQIVEEILAKDA